MLQSRSLVVLHFIYSSVCMFPGDPDGKESACHEGDPDSIPGLGRPPGGGHGNPLQFSCLENSHGQRSLVGYSPCDHKQSVMTERLSTAYKDKSYSSHMERNLVVSGLRDCGSNTSFPLLPIHPQPCCP